MFLEFIRKSKLMPGDLLLKLSMIRTPSSFRNFGTQDEASSLARDFEPVVLSVL